MSRKALGRGLSALFTQVEPVGSDLLEVDIDLLDPTDAQPRHKFNESKLKELAQSIKTNGVIQPLVVRRDGERFQIIAGERRWRAAALAGLKSISCVIKDVAQDSTLEMSLIENIQREELNPIEEATAYKRLIEQLGITQEEVAQRVGKDRSSIANALRLLKLPPEIQKLVEDEQLSMGHARALLAVDSTDRQKKLALEIVEKSLSVRDVEREAKRTAHVVRDLKNHPAEIDKERANITAAESKLSTRLQAPVKIRFGRSGGVLEIGFSSTDDLARLFDLLVRRLN